MLKSNQQAHLSRDQDKLREISSVTKEDVGCDNLLCNVTMLLQLQLQVELQKLQLNFDRP